MNDDNNYIRKYYASFLSSKNNEDVSLGSEYYSVEWRVYCQKDIILNLLLNKSKSFELQVSLLFLLSTTIKYNHTWLILVNTLIPKITTSIIMIKWSKWLLIYVVRKEKTIITPHPTRPSTEFFTNEYC